MEPGEICVKAPWLMKEYVNRPGVTLKYRHEDGFARTGDVGYYTAEGELYFVDRKADLIKSESSRSSVAL